jgi:hypothetical protein
MSSIDGNDPPAAFNEKWLPFMIQSPIAGYIAILTSSYFQATARQITWDKSVDVMGARLKLITLINGYLTSHQSALNDEAISTVMSLAYNEVWNAVCQLRPLLIRFSLCMQMKEVPWPT